MKLLKGTLTFALTASLVACGGGGSDGYYNNNAGSSSGGGSVTTPTTPENLAQAKTTLDALKKKDSIYFGNYDPSNKDIPKGFN